MMLLKHFNTLLLLELIIFVIFNLNINNVITFSENDPLPKTLPRPILDFPCTFSEDLTHGGILVDCRGKHLRKPPSDIFPLSTTTLLLQFNNIIELERDSFICVPHLKSLTISHNELYSIDPSTFHSNTELVFLDMESNYLRLDSDGSNFTAGIFDHLPNLTELRLAHNHNDEVGCGRYPHNLLMGLANLHTLTIDTFQGELNFSSLFRYTPRLSSLTITGGVTVISNESFHGLDSVELKSLVISLDDLFLTEQSAFRYLRHLDSFNLNGGRQGIRITLESLAPFTNRSLVSLNLDSVNDQDDVVGKTFNIITKNMTRFLTQICISHVAITNSGILYLYPDAFETGVWPQCLLSLDISDNPIIGSSLGIVAMYRFHALQSFRFVNRKFSFLFRQDYSNSDNDLDSLQCPPRSDSLSNPHNVFPVKEDRKQTCILRSKLTKINSGMLATTSLPTNNRMSLHYETNSTQYHAAREVLPLPMNLTYININRISNNAMALDSYYSVINGCNLLEIHASDSGITKFTGSFEGLENLHTVDVSKNDMSIISTRFFDSFPKLSRLNISRTHIDNVWILREGPEAFSKIPELTALEMSDNGLHIISPGIFFANTKLLVLGLARNHFNSIPIDLSLSPNMCLLDLRYNSILRLSYNDMKMIEDHRRRVKTFSIWLQGNIFVCGCSSLRFLSWLQRTRVRLDNDRDYSCVMETGNITSTILDLNAFWRKCYGKVAFLISLILASIIVLVLCLTLVGMKFETQLKAAFIEFIRKTSPIKHRSEYAYDVYLGYSDHDLVLGCEFLRYFMESQLGLCTYIRHRDLIPASDMSESIVSAINSSWRVVLVMTDHYLEDPWSFLAIKTAIYSVQAVNPNRLVIIFTSLNLPQHAILSSVLKVVCESNVVYVTSTEGLSVNEERLLSQALFRWC